MARKPLTCAAPGCTTPIVLPRFFVCLYHWSELPETLQKILWDEYRTGTPTEKWERAAADARRVLAK